VKVKESKTKTSSLLPLGNCAKLPHQPNDVKLRNLRPPLDLFFFLLPLSHRSILHIPIPHTETVAIMGYTDVDKLAINTIRLLAVRLISILAFHAGSYPSIRRENLFFSIFPPTL
jgi:hypothetical protein